MTYSLPIEIHLNAGQKSLLNQFANEDWVGIIAVYSGDKPVADHYSSDIEDLQLANVLYETDSPGTTVPRDNGLAKVGFNGIIASAAVW
jgi:hypothetical protein